MCQEANWRNFLQLNGIAHRKKGNGEEFRKRERGRARDFCKFHTPLRKEEGERRKHCLKERIERERGKERESKEEADIW